jgi:hypothetical protein
VVALQEALLRSVTAPPSPPAPRWTTAASKLRVARVADAALQSGPFCGDGNCDAGEDCKTCAQDCFQVCLSVSTYGRPAGIAAQVTSHSKPSQRHSVEFAWCHQAAYIANAAGAWVHAPICICPRMHVQVQLDAAGNRVRCKRVGIMYSVWHWPALRAMDIQRAAGKVPVTVEDVIRSRQETPTGEMWDGPKALPARAVQQHKCPKHCLLAYATHLSKSLPARSLWRI